jgi:hypothetical protein
MNIVKSERKMRWVVFGLVALSIILPYPYKLIGLIVVATLSIYLITLGSAAERSAKVTRFVWGAFFIILTATIGYFVINRIVPHP